MDMDTPLVHFMYSHERSLVFALMHMYNDGEKLGRIVYAIIEKKKIDANIYEKTAHAECRKLTQSNACRIVLDEIFRNNVVYVRTVFKATH